MNVSVYTGTAKGQQKIRKNFIWLANIETADFPLMHLLKHTQPRLRIHESFPNSKTLPNTNRFHFICITFDWSTTTVCGHHNDTSSSGTTDDTENDQFIGDREHDS